MAIKKTIEKSNEQSKTYTELQEELQNVTLRLESSDLSVDEAVKCYEEGLKLVTKLEKVLKTAENRIIELKASYKVEG
jgi:exodeoxyribonuclease VII small subunit